MFFFEDVLLVNSKLWTSQSKRNSPSKIFNISNSLPANYRKYSNIWWRTFDFINLKIFCYSKNTYFYIKLIKGREGHLIFLIPENLNWSLKKQDKRSLLSQALNNQILKLKNEKERDIVWLTEIIIKYKSLTH